MDPRRFWRHKTEGTELERALRESRPEPRSEFLQAVADRVRDHRDRRQRAFRVAFAVGLTSAMIAAVVSFGGVGYAAGSATDAVKAATAVVSSVAQSGPVSARDTPPRDHDPAHDQYHHHVVICHREHGRAVTLVLSQREARRHLHHHPHDTRGACPHHHHHP